MKNLVFAIFLFLIPSLIFCQGQRLGVVPASLSLSQDSPVGRIKSFCSDGRARSIPSSTSGKYNYFQSQEGIDVVIDGIPVVEGIGELIRQGELIIETKGDDEVILKLSPDSKIKTIDIQIKEPNVLSDRPEDFKIEQLWLDYLYKIKILPEGVSTFEQAKPFIKSFQELVKTKSFSGLLDEETRELIEIYSKSINSLHENSFLNEEFTSYDQVVKAYGAFLSEWEDKSNIPENILSQDFDRVSYFKYLTQYIEASYFVRCDDKIEKWTILINVETGAKKPIAKTTIQEADIPVLEKDYIEKVREYSALAKKDNIFYCLVGSLDMEKKSAKIFFAGKEKEISWADDPFEAISAHIQSETELLPSNATVIFTRDELQLGAEHYDKSDPDQLRGDSFHNLQYVPSRQWINITELSSRLRAHVGERRIVISNIRNITRDVDQLKTPPPMVKSGMDIMAVTAPESFDVKKDQIRALRGKLLEAQISVVEIGGNSAIPEQITQSNVIILSGHKDLQMEAYIKDLADNGRLKGKFVVGLSCYENGTTSLNTHVLMKGGALEVLLFPTQLDADAVKAVIYEMVGIVKNDLPEGGITMRELLYRAVDRAIEKYPDLVPALELIRGFIPQIAMHSTKKITANG